MGEENNKKGIFRRNFLKSGAAGTVGSALLATVTVSNSFGQGSW